MLLCPHCSFSNPETAITCMGCGRELPPDVSLGHSISEMSKWYDPNDDDEDFVPPESASEAAPSTPPPASRDKEKAGRASLISDNDLDSEVLGDMEAALDHLLRDDTGVGHTDDDAEVMDGPPSSFVPEHHGESGGAARASSKTAEREERSDASSSERSTRSDEATQKGGTPFPTRPAYVGSPSEASPFAAPPTEMSEPGRDKRDATTHSELEEASAEHVADERTTVAPLDPQTWKRAVSEVEQGQVASSSAEREPSETPKGAEESTWHGSQPPALPSSSPAEPAPLSEEPVPTLMKASVHRPAPTDRIDLRELQSLLSQSNAESSEAVGTAVTPVPPDPAEEHGVSTAMQSAPPSTPVAPEPIPGFSPDALSKASESATHDPTERLVMGRWGEDDGPQRPAQEEAWNDPSTVRDNVTPSGEEVEELGAEAIVEEDWGDTPVPTDASALPSHVVTSLRDEPEEDNPLSHTLGTGFPESHAAGEAASWGQPKESAQDTPTEGRRANPPQRWIAPDLGPFAYNDEEPLGSDTLRGRWVHTESAPRTEASPADDRTLGPWQDRSNAPEPRAFVVWQLDAESLQANVPLRKGQRTQILKELSDALVGALHQMQMEVQPIQSDRFVAYSNAQPGDVGLVVENALHILRDVIQRFEPSLSARVRGRCVVTLGAGDAGEGLDEALLVAQRLLRGMPVDRVWLDWGSYQRWQQPLPCLEIVLPSLEEPAYEVDDSRLWPDASETRQSAPLARPPWVGRHVEMSTLHHPWTQTTQHNASPKVLILGEPGSGRSRLVEEWRRQVQDRMLFFGGGAAWCPPQAGESPYLASLLASHLQTLGVEPVIGLPERLAALSQQPGLPADIEPSQRTQALLELLTEPRGSQTQQVEALEWLIRASTVEAPVLLVLDDLFLLDRGAQSLVDNLFQNPSPRVMTVIVSSPGEYEEILFSTLPDAARVELGPLSMEECYQLVEGVWPSSRLHHEQLARLVEQSEGHPQILLTLVQHQLEPHARVREITWSHQPSLPQSVEHSILRRLRTLSSLEQDTLRKAAVVGDRFWKGSVEALERLSIRDGDWGLQDGVMISTVDDRGECLERLQQKGLIEPLAISSIVGEKEYRFQHRLLRNLCMRQLPSSVRQSMHASVAQWLQVRDRDRTLVPELSRHLKMAGQHEEAARQLLAAAEEAFGQFRYRHALSLLSECMEGEDVHSPLLQLQTRYLSGKAYEQLGDLNAAIQLYRAALKRSWQLTDPHWGARLYLAVARCQAWRGELTDALSSSRNATTLAERADDESLDFAAQIQQARTQLMDGQVAEAFVHIKEAKATLDDNQDAPPLERALFLSTVGWMYRTEGKWSDSVLSLQEAARLYQAADQPILYAQIVVQQAEFFLAAGDEESAIPLLEKAASLLRARESYRLLVHTLTHLAHAFLRQRSAQKAQALLQEAWQHARVSGESGLIALVAAALACTFTLVRQSKDALRYARIASQRLHETAPQIRGWVYHFLGDTASSMHDAQAPHIFAQPPAQLPEGGILTYCYLKAVEMFKRVGDAANQLSSLLALTRALFASGFARTAAHILERGIADAKQLGLGLLLERMNNQRRLLKGEEPAEQIDASVPAGHSTLVVRQKGKRNASAYPGAPSSGSSSEGNRWQSAPTAPSTPEPPTRQNPVAVAPSDAPGASHDTPGGRGTNILPLPPGEERRGGPPRKYAPSRPASMVPRPSYPPPKGSGQK